MMNDRIIITFNEGNVAEIEVNDSIRIFKINEDAGTSLQLNTETGVLSLLDKKGNVISQVDFPTEKIITNAYYDYASQELVLEFENSPSVRIPIKTDLDNYYTKEEVYSKEQIDKKLEDFDSTNYSVLVGQETIDDKTTLYQMNADGTLNKDKPIQTGLSKEEVVEIVKENSSTTNYDVLVGQETVDEDTTFYAMNEDGTLNKDEPLSESVQEVDPEEVDAYYEIAKSDNIKETSDYQVPTTKAVKTMIDNVLGELESLLEAI